VDLLSGERRLAGERVVITGATGFLGGTLARRLAARGVEVTGLGRGEAQGRALEAAGVKFVKVDLGERGPTMEALRGATVAFHCAGLSSLWGSKAEFWRANVEATRHVIEGCERHGVARLVHVSTPSMYQDGQSRRSVREDEPLPKRFINHYAASKWEADQLVLGAARRGLWAVMLRPRAVFGPGDPSVFPRLLRVLETGRLPRVGSGQNRVDLTFIENAVDALELAAVAPSRCAGQVYNVSNGEPVVLWEVIGRLAARLGLPPIRGRVPRAPVYGLAVVAERAYRALDLPREPALTRYGVDVLTLDMTLDISKARAELGYEPRVSVDEGLEIFAKHWMAQKERGDGTR
jgi:nucleoside-diphosphate-sugar epimerase